MEGEGQKILEINRHKKFMSLKVCSECGSRMLVNREQLTIFHPAINTIVQNISEVVTRFPDSTQIKRKFPATDCRNLCAAKALANSLIENLTRNEPKSLVYIQELSEKITSASNVNLITRDQKYCNLCSLRFRTTCHTVNHLILRHPECLALVQFLQSRPLSELNIPKDVGVLHQSFVKLEKNPSRVNKECITKEYISLKQNTSALSNFVAQPNSHLNKISKEIVQNSEKVSAEMKEDIFKTSQNRNKKDTSVILFPKIIFKTRRDTCSSKKTNSSHRKNAVALSTSKIIRYGVKDLERDRLRTQLKREQIEKKEKILKKMLAKYHEKETKKEVLYWQKKLTRYVMQHQNLLLKLEHDLINARQSGMQSKDKLLEKVCNYVTNDKVKNAVIYLLEELFEAMKKVPGIKEIDEVQFEMDSSSAENSFEEVDQSQNPKCSSAKDRKHKNCTTSNFLVEDISSDFSSTSDYKLSLDTEDPFILPSFVTDDKQLFLCFCGKLDCVGLHPESFY